jgi:hypothetical protein
MTINISQLLHEAEENRLWGSIQFDFQGGELVLVRKTETMKPTPTRTEQTRDHVNKH